MKLKKHNWYFKADDLAFEIMSMHINECIESELRDQETEEELKGYASTIAGNASVILYESFKALVEKSLFELDGMCESVMPNKWIIDILLANMTDDFAESVDWNKVAIRMKDQIEAAIEEELEESLWALKERDSLKEKALKKLTKKERSALGV